MNAEGTPSIEGWFAYVAWERSPFAFAETDLWPSELAVTTTNRFCSAWYEGYRCTRSVTLSDLEDPATEVKVDLRAYRGALPLDFWCDPACDRTVRLFGRIEVTGAPSSLADVTELLETTDFPNHPNSGSDWPSPGQPLVPGLRFAGSPLEVPSGVQALGPVFAVGASSTGDYHAVFAVNGDAERTWNDVLTSMRDAFVEDVGEPQAGPGWWRVTASEAGGFHVAATMITTDSGDGAYLAFEALND